MSSLLRSSQQLRIAPVIRRSTRISTTNTINQAIRSFSAKSNHRVVAANRFINCNYPSPSQFRGFRSSAVNMGVNVIKSKAEFDAALKQHKVVVVDAFAEWCGPCKIISPKVEEYSKEYEDAYFIKFDVDELPDVAQELGIRAMPTFLFFKDGDKVGEVVGANPPAIQNAIKTAIA
ncbi:thioredoxin TrxA [Xylogone sp. PMI_703]|nr:thioredoxin TrxA [Xylogone sp. PMI_703]